MKKGSKNKKRKDDDDDDDIESDDDDDDDGIHTLRTGSIASSMGKSAVDYDIDVNLKEHEKPSLILYKYRWVVLFAFFLTSAATGAV